MGGEMSRLTDDRPEPGRPSPPKSLPAPRSPFLPPEPPPPRPQLPPSDPALGQRALAALILGILSLMAMLLIGNLQRAAAVAAVALAVALAGLLLAASTARAAKRAGTSPPRGTTAGLVLSLLGLLFSGFALVGFLVFGAQIDQYSSCMNQATTPTQQQACRTQLEHAIDNRLGISTGS
jgi:hypothetical protein